MNMSLVFCGNFEEFHIPALWKNYCGRLMYPGLPEKSDIESFTTIVNGQSWLPIVAKCSVLDVAEVLDSLLAFKVLLSMNVKND